MKLAVFDLDHTLLPLNSGDLWPRWVAKYAGVDPAPILAEADRLNADYHRGEFDPEALTGFHLKLLARFQRIYLDAWLDAFIDEVIRPAVKPEALALVDERRRAGWTLLLATGTHSFVSAPVAALFGITNLVAARPEEDEKGEFTGRLDGPHSYGAGKLKLVRDFIRIRETLCGDKVEAVEAYSDSMNDLPLLDFAAGYGAGSRAVAVNASSVLADVALQRGWATIELFPKEGAHV